MRRVISGTALLVSLLAASVLTQEAASPREPGRIVRFVFIRSSRFIADNHATPAELMAIEANLLNVADLLKATRLLSPPMGYDIRFTGTLNPPDPAIAKTVTTIAYSLEFSFLDYLRSPTSPAFRTPFANQGLKFCINDPYRILRGSSFRDSTIPLPSWSEDKGEPWLDPPSEDLKGVRFARVCDMVAITKAAAPLLTTVATDRFLGTYLAEKRKDAQVAEIRLTAIKRTYDVLQSAETQAERQKDIEAARARKNGEVEARRLRALPDSKRLRNDGISSWCRTAMTSTATSRQPPVATRETPAGASVHS